MVAEVYADICQLLKVISLKHLKGEDKDLLKKLECFYKEIPVECFKVGRDKCRVAYCHDRVEES